MACFPDQKQIDRHHKAITVARQLWYEFVQSEAEKAVTMRLPHQKRYKDFRFMASHVGQQLLSRKQQTAAPSSVTRCPKFGPDRCYLSLLRFATPFRDWWEKAEEQSSAPPNEDPPKDEEGEFAPYKDWAPKDDEDNADEHSGESREESVQPTPRRNMRPPRIQFVKFDTDPELKNVLEQNAKDKEEKRLNEPGTPNPVSWLFQKRKSEKVDDWDIIILIDPDAIAQRYHQRHQSVYGTKLLTIKCILHELIHYIMHSENILPALPENEFEAVSIEDQVHAEGATADEEDQVLAQWATADEEEQAWIGAMTLYGLMVGAIAANLRDAGQADGEIEYLWY